MSQGRDEAKSLTPLSAHELADSQAVSNRRRLAYIAGGVPLALLLLIVAGWAIDGAVSGDRVVRNVVIDAPGAPDTELGGLTEAELESIAADLTDRLATQPATLIAGPHDIPTDPATLGVRVDPETLANSALDARRGGSVLTRPFRWVGTFFSEQRIDVPYVVIDDAAENATQLLVGAFLDQPLEPTLDLVGGALAVTPGGEGAEVEPGALALVLPAMMVDGPPYVAEIDLIALEPDLDTAALEAVAAEANDATSGPVIIEVLGAQVQVESDELRSWIVLDDTSSAGPTWSIDNATALAALLPLFPGLGSEDQQARFNLVDNQPVILPASESVVCCAEDTSERIKNGLLDPPASAPPLPVEADEDDPDDDDADEGDVAEIPVIELVPQISGSDEGVAELESLGIIEQVATFTTNHSCCENRVKNIQLMADIVQGHVIRPGERFDLNEVVGRRTSERGFLPAGAIAEGVVEAQVGGGVSQFTTTIFNASFFAGLDFIEYQSHSLYFSRYPRGREATISWPKPDFIVENNTPYGVLVWTSYTDTSITVTMYSTPNVDVTCVLNDGTLVEGVDGCDGAVRTSSQGACTRNTTVRNRVFEDGTSIEDSVFAVYRPGEGLDCAGNSTRPTTTTVPVDTVPPDSTDPSTPEPTTPPDTPAPTQPPPTDPPPTDPPPTDPPPDG